MTFVPLLLPALVAVAVLWGVGGFLSWAVGLRGVWALAAAPAFALTLVAGTAVVASWLKVPWSILPVAVLTLVVGMLIRWARHLWGGASPSAERMSGSWVVPVVLVVTAVVITVRVVEIIQAPGNISQTFDNIFHLNGVRYALSEGDASSLRLGYMTSVDGSLPFYPAAWHGIVSLVVQLSGATIPVAINAFVIVVSALIWPLAAVILTRTLFGRRPAFTVAAAVLAAAVPAFPILLMDYGVLYPLQLSLALLPVALAATLCAVRVAPQDGPRGSGWWTLIVIGVIPGLTLAHPGGFVAWLALTVPAAFYVIIRAFRRARSGRRRVVIAVGALAYLVIGAIGVRVLRPPAEARGWPTQMSMVDAAWQVVSVSMWYLVPAVVVAVCVVAGVVWAFIDRTPRALLAVAMYAVAAGLFVVVAALPFGALRDALTGSWYNNLPRLAAILGVTLVPLGAYGAARSWLAVSVAWKRAGSARGASARLAAVVGAALAVVFLVATQIDGAMARAVSWASSAYELDDSSPLLSASEYTLLERLPEEVPADAVIAGSPWTGTSLAYAISDRRVLMPHTLMYVSDEVETINDGLDHARRGDATCAALADLGVGYVLDFGRKEVHPGEHVMAGLDDLSTSSAVELIDQEGHARLYRIVACG